MEKQKIAFFSLYETENVDSFVGALLVTDNHGIPLEFKCTHAIKPTAIQKSLYGEKLKPYIAVILSGIPLLNNISNKPDLLFVNIPYVLGLRTEIKTPTFLIKRAGESINIQSDESDSEKHRIEDELGQYQTIILQSHPNHKDEFKSFNGIINQLFNNFDLIEPFERMNKSIKILGEKDNHSIKTIKQNKNEPQLFAIFILPLLKRLEYDIYTRLSVKYK